MNILKSVFVLLFSAMVFYLDAQCISYTFNTQESIDEFFENNPNCTSLLKVKFTGDDISDLSGFVNMTYIGELEIDGCPILSSLNGFQSLDSIGELEITNNPLLLNLDGLNNLKSVNNIILQDLDKLIDVTGLSNLKRVHEDFIIARNDELKEIKELNNLDSIGANLRISSNPVLETIKGFNELKKVVGSLSLNGELLNVLPSFQNLKSAESISIIGIPDTLYIFENLQVVKSITLNFLNVNIANQFPILILDSLLSLSITAAGADDISAFKEIKSLENLTLRNLSGNADLSTFQNLEEVDNVWISGCNEIESFSGMINFRSNINQLIIEDCVQLQNIDGWLQAGSKISRIDLRDLPLLSTIGAFENCAQLEELTLIRCKKLITLSPPPSFSPVFDLRIDSCRNITNLDAFVNLAKAQSITLVDLPELENTNGLSNLDTITRITSIARLNILQHFNLSNLSYSNGDFFIFNCDALEKFSCPSLVSVLRINFYQLPKLNAINLPNMLWTSRLLIEENPSLSNLNNFNNNVSINTLEINNNPLLETCNEFFICRLVNSSPTRVRIRNNGAQCEETILRNQFCNPTSFYIHPFYDFNQNGLREINEPSIKGFNFILNEQPIIVICDTQPVQGILGLPDEPNILSIGNNPDWKLTSDSSTYSLQSDQLNSPYEFGFYPDTFYSNLSSFGLAKNVRCNTETQVDFFLLNEGTNFDNGILWIELDSLFENIQPSIPPDFNLEGRILGYSFVNLLRGTIDFSISLKNPGPPDFEIGDSVSLKSWVEIRNEIEPVFTDTVVNKYEILCSYDPNDKLVFPNRSSNFTLFEEDLTYTIRFQNTGNADAIDVAIRDTISEHLDLSTFSFIGSSHEEILKINFNEGREIVFDFQEIYLPDSSTNFDASNGFVSFKISTNPSLLESTAIENKAFIYFDFNPPIITNTTNNIMVSQLPTFISQLSKELEITLFPNPTSNEIYINGPDLKNKFALNIYDLQGKLLYQNNNQREKIIQTKSFPEGIYILKIQQTDGVFLEKFLKIISY